MLPESSNKNKEIKSWQLWVFVGVLMFPFLHWNWNNFHQSYWNAQYIKLGKAVDCRTRPSPEYLQYCNPASDGVACASESRSRLIEWHGPIDYACAQYEPEKIFVFKVQSSDDPADADIWGSLP